MQRSTILLTLLGPGLAACASGGGYASTELIYAEPAEYVYIVPVDRVVLVSRRVLVTHGYTVYRVERSGPDRILWARHPGGNELVRIFVTPRGDRVAVRGLREVRSDRGRHHGWERRGPPDRVLSDIAGRLRGH